MMTNRSAHMIKNIIEMLWFLYTTDMDTLMDILMDKITNLPFRLNIIYHETVTDFNNMMISLYDIIMIVITLFIISIILMLCLRWIDRNRKLFLVNTFIKMTAYIIGTLHWIVFGCTFIEYTKQDTIIMTDPHTQQYRDEIIRPNLREPRTFVLEMYKGLYLIRRMYYNRQEKKHFCTRDFYYAWNAIRDTFAKNHPFLYEIVKHCIQTNVQVVCYNQNIAKSFNAGPNDNNMDSMLGTFTSLEEMYMILHRPLPSFTDEFSIQPERLTFDYETCQYTVY